MRFFTTIRIFFWILLAYVLQSCGTAMSFTSNKEVSTMGEITSYTTELRNLPLPKEKVVVGVYKFRDQTGQYKPSENGANWSTAVPQGTTTILIKALEDSRWFTPIERENIANLLNERQIIRSTRQEYLKDVDKNSQALPPLLYAGMLLEGGVISYDSNVMTGGIGARYFGIGASSQYRQDRITIYLRAVSTLNGEILKTVYVSKTILSTSINGSFFKYIDTERLMEAEVGFTQNEPIQLAVTDAIEKAVKSLIIEGIKDKIWGKSLSNLADYQKLVDDYDLETQKNTDRQIGNIYPTAERSKLSIFGQVEGNQVRNDYVNPVPQFGLKGGIKFFFDKNFNVELSASAYRLENENILRRTFISPELNLEYFILPKYKFSPFIYAGVGAMFSTEPVRYKSQFGGGFEYLAFKKLGIRISSQYDLGFSDDWDLLANGKRTDHALRFGLGLNLYLGNKK
ncbi:MAG: curli production assembly protein CsgG [Chryseobacterium sp.]|jgi:curli production assembly/transport component CsgG|nr:curli production assembly protein CsgG [Chryseobacterium sp.]